MYSPSKQAISSLLAVILLVAGLTSCNPTSSTNIPGTSTPTSTLSASHPESGTCLSSHDQPPYANIQVSHDRYLAHSEPMLAEDPENPLHLVGGSKFFTDLVHYRFKIGYFTSFDGGCTWMDGGLLPGFGADVLTSDPTFAFGTNHEVYAAVLNAVDKGESGILVFTSNDGGKTFGSPVSVFSDKTGRVFSDKPWITVEQTEGLTVGLSTSSGLTIMVAVAASETSVARSWPFHAQQIVARPFRGSSSLKGIHHSVRILQLDARLTRRPAIKRRAQSPLSSQMARLWSPFPIAIR